MLEFKDRTGKVIKLGDTLDIDGVEGHVEMDGKHVVVTYGDNRGYKSLLYGWISKYKIIRRGK